VVLDLARSWVQATGHTTSAIKRATSVCALERWKKDPARDMAVLLTTDSPKLGGFLWIAVQETKTAFAAGA
jgi:hypothetical protein